MFNYIRDGINPRGAEYGATARAADAAKRNADTAEDLLALQLATPADYEFVASQIRDRRRRETSRRAIFRYIDLVAAVLFVTFLTWYVLTPASEAPRSAVTISAPAGVSTDTDDANVPETSAQASDANGYPTPAEIERDRRERPLHRAELKQAGLEYSDAL